MSKQPEKPLRADARRNRARVLEAAEELFASDGIAVPLDDIARRAGVGPGTVYRHFPTKEALFQAVLSERIAQLNDEVRSRASTDDPGAAFFDLFDHVVEAASVNKGICDALEGSGAALDREAAHCDFTSAFAEVLASAQERGAVRADIRFNEVQSLLVSCVAMHRRAVEQNREPHEVAVVRDGLRKQPSDVM
ncbi:helix-turn-helix domain-containing protein [Saccharopolyspora taberi]|uniref:TetR/AcrR family transcriptional regulator n=1 Tax=Saccharopolyspora taberi TaxID=60895 RepID=A0ABN3VL09_9PSEU